MKDFNKQSEIIVVHDYIDASIYEGVKDSN